MNSLVVGWSILIFGIILIVPYFLTYISKTIRLKKAVGVKEVIDACDRTMNDSRFLFIVGQAGCVFFTIGAIMVLISL